MTWAEAEAAFAAKFDRYEVRLPQRELATQIERVLADDLQIQLADPDAAHIHLAAQAGCGVGKSYGGMVPAIDHAKTTGRPVVAATATKALQNQYVRDLEALQDIYRDDFTFALLKGRSAYICRANLDAASASETDVNLSALRSELTASDTTGDMDRLQLDLTPKDRAVLSMSADECPGKKECPFGTTCFAEAAKAKAMEADVVVTNHAMLVTDANLRAKHGVAMLPPEISAVIIDEAHELNEYATSSLSSRIAPRSYSHLAREIVNFSDADDELVVEVTVASEALFTAMGTFLTGESKTATTRRLRLDDVLGMEKEFAALIEALQTLEAPLRKTDTWGDDARGIRKRKLGRRLYRALDVLLDIATAEFGELVRWVEKEKTKKGEDIVVVKGAPLQVADFLRANIWKSVPAVLMSATLAVGTDFGLLKYQLGFGSEMREFDAGTPFDFTTQARLYVPDMPDPQSEKGMWQASIIVQLSELLKASQGRGLLLFTSWDSLNNAYKALAPMIKGWGFRTFKQGDMPTQRLSQTFSDDEHSVLFAVKSFYTGVDIQGSALVVTVMDKMPFPNPTDVVFQARCEAMDDDVARRGLNKWRHGSFQRLSVPTMALTLLQGFGRTIRSMDDQGMVVILDPRIRTKAYGKQVLNVLPPAPLLTELDEATTYLEQVVA